MQGFATDYARAMQTACAARKVFRCSGSSSVSIGDSVGISLTSVNQLKLFAQVFHQVGLANRTVCHRLLILCSQTEHRASDQAVTIRRAGIQSLRQRWPRWCRCPTCRLQLARAPFQDQRRATQEWRGPMELSRVRTPRNARSSTSRAAACDYESLVGQSAPRSHTGCLQSGSPERGPSVSPALPSAARVQQISPPTTLGPAVNSSLPARTTSP